MGCGLATDDRSHEEGRHYTDDSAVRLHGCGPFGEAKPLKHPTLPAPGSCRSELAREKLKGAVGHQVYALSLNIFASKLAPTKQLKKRAWGLNPQALKR
ncbi:hypothetical protein EMIT0P74_80200 [Pseudomonas sp. IT-P74]